MEWRKVSYTGKCGAKKVKIKAHQLLGVEGHLEAMETSPLSKFLRWHLSPSLQNREDMETPLLCPEKRGLDSFQQLATLYSLLNRQGWRELSAVRESCPT